MPPDAAPDTKPSHAAMQHAAEWFALLRSGDATEQDRADWQSWLAQSPEHRDAWNYAESTSRRFAPVQTPESRRAAAAALTQVRQTRNGRRHLLRGIVALAGTGLLGWAGWRHSPLPELALAWSADHHTGTGEIRDIALADGTRIWLNTASALNADYQPALRRVDLLGGEMLIETAHDARPFVATTRHGRLRALGTRFTVRLDGDTTLLAVYQGAVEVRTGQGALRVINAGSQARFDSVQIQPTVAADPAREAWTRGVLLAADIPLKDLVAELRRYHRGHIGVAPQVAELRVLGGYPLRDPERALAMLESVLPIRVQRTLPWWTTIEPK
jgi:transmembrane sensor